MNTCETKLTIEKEIQIAASATRIFAALTTPEERIRWWGVNGKFEVTHMQSDLRPGGDWHRSGLSMGETPFTIGGTYQIIEPPRVLEFTWKKDAEARETIVRFDLEENEAGTLLRLTHTGFTDEEARNSYQGWPWLLSMLQSHVENDPSQPTA